MNATTSSGGAATFAYVRSKHAAVGTYQVQANMTSSTKAATTAGASASFTVQ
ncbi:MAG TPA: hypothetical protein VGV15_03565 [Terriglobales bacterium]|nr:hypothetical protein [Terriglobales bacterium]